MDVVTFLKQDANSCMINFHNFSSSASSCTNHQLCFYQQTQLFTISG